MIKNLGENGLDGRQAPRFYAGKKKLRMR